MAAIVKKVSLEPVVAGWDEECVAYVIPATYAEQLELDKLDFAGKTNEQQVEWQLDFVRKHFAGGKIKVYEDGEFKLVTMTAEHAVSSVEVADFIYAEVMGFVLDPKALKAAAMNAAASSLDQQRTSTETTSSTT